VVSPPSRGGTVSRIQKKSSDRLLVAGARKRSLKKKSLPPLELVSEGGGNGDLSARGKRRDVWVCQREGRSVCLFRRYVREDTLDGEGSHHELRHKEAPRVGGKGGGKRLGGEGIFGPLILKSWESDTSEIVAKGRTASPKVSTHSTHQRGGPRRVAGGKRRTPCSPGWERKRTAPGNRLTVPLKGGEES